MPCLWKHKLSNLLKHFATGSSECFDEGSTPLQLSHKAAAGVRSYSAPLVALSNNSCIKKSFAVPNSDPKTEFTLQLMNFVKHDNLN